MILQEDFNNQTINKQLQWHKEPAKWLIKNNQLHLYTDKETDFWQRTHYGFQADNGHFLYANVQGDFTLESNIQCNYQNQYDQAGLMVRVSDQCWVKTSVEYEHDKPNKLGAVVTNYGYSDWSTQDVKDEFTDYKLRITRKGSCYKVSYFNENDACWVQMRLFQLFDQPEVQVGIYACSPKENGFSADFNYLHIDRLDE